MGDGERDEAVEDGVEPYQDRRFMRREKELCMDGLGLGVTEPGVTDPGVLAGVDAVFEDSKLMPLMLDFRAEDSILVLLSSSVVLGNRCTLIFGLFCNSAIRSRACSAGTLGSTSSGVVQPEESGGEMSTSSSAGAMRSASEKLPLIVTIDGLA